MNFLRGVFFGLIQFFELPANAVVELWRLPGRGRGLLLGFPAIFALLLTLIAIGWAKYGSNQDMLDDYWRVHQRNRTELNELNQAIGDSQKTVSTLGNVEESSPSAAAAKPESEGVLAEITREIQREIFEPSGRAFPGNPRVSIRIQLNDSRDVESVEVIESSGYPEWDKAVQHAVERTDAFKGSRPEDFVTNRVDLDFGLLESRREKLLYSMIIGLKKLIDLDASKPEFKYEYGLLAADMGNLSQARLMMDQIAPADKPGMSKAHLWQARQIWAEKSSPEPVASRQSRCMNHLRMALTSDPGNIEANEGLGELYFAIGNYAEAEKHYRLVWEKQLSPTLRLVSIYLRQNDKVKLEEILTKSKRRLEETLSKDPENLTYIFDVERLCALQGNLDEAIEFLQSHLTDDNRDQIRARLAQIYSGWAKSDAANNKGVFTEAAFEKCKKAFEYDPKSADTLWILTVIGFQDSSFAPQAVALYDPVKNRADAPALVLREYASHLIKQGQNAEAIEWLETAYDRFANDPITANNLAYLLISATPPDPERALTIISKAIEIMPANALPEVRASLYDTKAAALVALKRHIEAIPYLEASLQFRGNHRGTIAALRDCYKATGRQEVADFYERLLDEQAASQNPNQ